MTYEECTIGCSSEYHLLRILSDGHLHNMELIVLDPMKRYVESASSSVFFVSIVSF